MARNRDYKAEYAKRKARAIIREREAKRGKPLSANYRRRIEKALQQGKTLQQARGHKAREHITRREHKLEREENAGLTNDQVREIFAWGERRSFLIKDSDMDGMDYVHAAQRSGWKWFTNYRKVWNAAYAKYLHDAKSGVWISKGMGYLEMLTAKAEAPSVSWLYYH